MDINRGSFSKRCHGHTCKQLTPSPHVYMLHHLCLTVKWPFVFTISETYEQAVGLQPLVIRCNCLEMRVSEAHTKGLLQGEVAGLGQGGGYCCCRIDRGNHMGDGG